MNIVAAIKKFVNSKNPAQPEFFPLDTLIRNQNVLYASDNLHRMLYSGQNSYTVSPGGTQTTSLSKFTAINTGTLKIKLSAWWTGRLSSVYVKLKKNGTEIMSTQVTAQSANNSEKVFDNVPFKDGDKFEIYITARNSSDYNITINYKDLGIYGDVTAGIFIIE